MSEASATSLSGSRPIFETPKWNMNGKLTSWLGRITVALAIIAAVGVVLSFLVHGGAITGFGGDAMMFIGGGGAALLGGGWVISKVLNGLEAKRNSKLWKSEENRELIDGLAAEYDLRQDVSYTQKVELNGKSYYIKVDKEEKTATISKNK